MTAFGSYLRRKRREAWLSQRDLAKAIGCSHVYVSEIERGTKHPFPEKYWPALLRVLPGLDERELAPLAKISKSTTIVIPPQYSRLADALNKRIRALDLDRSEIETLIKTLGD